jgi:hypothetical protein
MANADQPQAEFKSVLRMRPIDDSGEGDGNDGSEEPDVGAVIPPFAPAEYLLELPHLRASTLRSRSRDTIWVGFGAEATAGPASKSWSTIYKLGRIDTGYHALNLRAPPLPLSAPQDKLGFAYLVENTDAPDEKVGPALQAALEARLSRAMGATVRARSRQRLVLPAGDTFPPTLLNYLGMRPSNGEPPPDDEPLVDVSFTSDDWDALKELIFSECDGPVAGFSKTFSAEHLWNGTHVVPGWGREEAHVGTDAPNCGARSLYAVAWGIRRVGA